jgi:hypothetical protein
VAVSNAATPDDYLAEQPPERAALLACVRALVNASLPAGFVERMNWGMICWELPLEACRDTYNGQPLAAASLAAQKNYNALYLNCVYINPDRDARLRQAYAAAGRKLDMGKSCLRFRKAEDLLDEAIGEALREVTSERLIADYEAVHGKQDRKR